MIKLQGSLQFFILFVLTYPSNFYIFFPFLNRSYFILFHPILSQSSNSWFEHNLFSQAISLSPPLLYTDQIILIQSMIIVHFLQVSTRQQVHIHPSSALFGTLPPHVLFTELVQTGKCYMRNVSIITPEWLQQVMPSYARLHPLRQLDQQPCGMYIRLIVNCPLSAKQNVKRCTHETTSKTTIV